MEGVGSRNETGSNCLVEGSAFGNSRADKKKDKNVIKLLRHNVKCLEMKMNLSVLPLIQNTMVMGYGFNYNSKFAHYSRSK